MRRFRPTARLLVVTALLGALLAVPSCRPWPAGAAAAPGPDPSAIVRDWVAALTFTPSTIGINPTRGLVGLASWFWVSGETGAPVTGRVVVPATETIVTIEVGLADVHWEFGDGTALDAGLGDAYPTPSSVHHTYERRATYRVTATLRYAVRYRVNSGPWLDGEPVRRAITTDHRVIEIRSFLRFIARR